MGSFLSDREKYRKNIERKKFLNSKLVLCEISTRELIRLDETRSRFERPHGEAQGDLAEKEPRQMWCVVDGTIHLFVS